LFNAIVGKCQIYVRKFRFPPPPVRHQSMCSTDSMFTLDQLWPSSHWTTIVEYFCTGILEHIWGPPLLHISKMWGRYWLQLTNRK
jgi:hypothetical protein